MKRFWERIIKLLRDPASQTIIAIIALIATVTWGTVQGWLSEFINWLPKSTPIINWVILVSCAIVILLGMSWVKSKFRKPREVTKNELQKHQPLAKSDTYSTSPRPKEIIDQIDSIPPFQKNNVQKSFEGIKVKWRLKFWDIVDTDNTIAWLQLSGYEDLSNANIYIHANMREYPKIKTLKRDESLFVVAEIKEITDHHTIWLINAIIRFSGEE